MSLPIKTLLDYYQRIRTAINQKTRLIIDYQPKNKLIEHWTIHPYELFQYKDMWYLLGYRQKTALAEGKIITLKLNRIRQLETTDISFYFPDDFKLHDYVTSFGMAIGPKQDVVLKIKNRFYISEYLYGENQTITSLDDETVILSVVMQGEISIKQLVMSLGSDCEVLKPEWLKAAIIEESRKLLANY
ncbi:hypothetical protein SDC9_133900 [bioreactor metagenome]|uniref:Uncharacterized protein n=1 Tax=bioreactor metagenome TaxID=1076179 RepID=A0A645DCQ5_9ZZZZ